ncbi:hypothetical protein [Geomesophilobacter sediminis]|uniref:Uncharacterized protein n=1 Tax=Geomesophilobacter sediminis TaxID=2798584 RepID=A0A8J7M0K8_9BACT|nr:hypothetical protein [Geomesophilobacter sediminis]MBJ6725712.1 hypothetical protein [Geomesophilobacter sediminis]
MSDPAPVSNARLVGLGLLICLVAAGVCVGLDRYGASCRKSGVAAAAGVAPASVVRLATPEAAYRFWRERGYHGRTVLYVASGWERIDPNQFGQDDPRRNYPLSVYRTADHVEKNFLDRRTFLYVAALQGVARRVIAVLGPAAFQEAREQAKNAKNVRLGDGTIYLTYQGFPRWFVTGERLFAPGEPVLLYVAASAFKESTPAELVARLKRAGVKTDAAVLCDDTGNPEVTAGERGALDEFARLLERGGR